MPTFENVMGDVAVVLNDNYLRASQKLIATYQHCHAVCEWILCVFFSYFLRFLIAVVRSVSILCMETFQCNCYSQKKRRWNSWATSLAVFLVLYTLSVSISIFHKCGNCTLIPTKSTTYFNNLHQICSVLSQIKSRRRKTEMKCVSHNSNFR